MGRFSDLLYYGGMLGPGGVLRLLRDKATKGARKRRLAAALTRPEDSPARFTRLGLPADASERRRFLEASLAPWVELVAPSLDPNEITQRAEQVLAGVQILFGAPCRVGWPPRWEWRWNGTPIAADFQGDLRSTWEIQRLQGVLPLAWAAHVEQGDSRERYASAYVAALVSFHEAYPMPETAAWESALELGLRLIALAQGLPLVVTTRAFAEHESTLLLLLDRHARWLAADLSLDKALPGNHLLGELAGLLAAGHLIPSARRAWWEDLDPQALLGREILRQFHADGVSVEQSLPYEKFILEFLVLAAGAAALRDAPLDPGSRERLLTAIVHLESVTAPDGHVPLVGDNDSGRGATWGEADPARLGDLPERARRVLGAGNVYILSAGTDSDSPPHPDDLCVRRFVTGGHAVGRTSAKDHVFLRAGPFGWGTRGPCSHSHADWLAPILTLGGEPVLIDTGVYGYLVPAPLRDSFRGADAHNGISWTPPRPPRPSAVFRWADLTPRARLESADDHIGGEVVWPSSQGPLRWRRSIHYNRLDQTWLIQDQLDGPVRDPATWSFWLAPGITLEPQREPGVQRIALPSGRRYVVRFEPAGSMIVDKGFVAPAYGRRTETWVLRRSLGPDERASRIRIAPAGS